MSWITAYFVILRDFERFLRRSEPFTAHCNSLKGEGHDSQSCPSAHRRGGFFIKERSDNVPRSGLN